MKKDSKVRLFEVMSRLDKTFKPKLNEGFEEIEATDAEVPAQTGGEFPEKEELSVEEKYEELKNKVEELYAMIHGEESEESEESEVEPEGEMNERKKWNFEKKGEKESDDDEDNESKEHEKSETPAEEKAEHKVDETKAKKIPVAAIAKVGK